MITNQTQSPTQFNITPNKRVPVRYFLSMLIMVFLLSLMMVINHYNLVSIDATVLMLFRWIFLVMLIGYAAMKRSLTTWILISMIAGAEFGFDFPAISINLNVISQIFLRLIKTIIAPLLFATIVVGIAGHLNLKQVGKRCYILRSYQRSHFLSDYLLSTSVKPELASMFLKPWHKLIFLRFLF